MATQIAKAYVQIVPSAQGISGSISSAIGGEASSAGLSAGESLGNNLVSKLKGIVAAAGIGTVLKEALSAGGDLQQSFGGLDTLYGEASEAAKDYAKQAAEAGISMNDYAEQAVSFGAGLKAAFGGDTTKAVEAANTAILDMADNSAKMGTDLSSIQNAYQGFAKQNYTMLDNLKLGYGGTKTEMERLLADASKLESAMGKTFDINNLGDVYEAIHLIQDDLGLTGVAAEEAKTTFTGSMQAMKAAATNLLAELTTGGDVTGALSGLITSTGSFLFDNLVPMLGNLISALPGVVKQLITEGVPQLLSALDGLFDTIWSAIRDNTSSFIEEGANMLSSLIDGFFAELPTAISRLVELMGEFIDWFATNYNLIYEKGIEILMQLITGITDNLPAIVEGITTVMIKMITTIIEHLPQIIETGLKLIAALVVGLIKAIPSLIIGVGKCIVAIANAFKNVDWAELGRNILEGIKNGILNAIHVVVDAAKQAASAIFNSVKGFFKIGSPSKLMNEEIGQWIPAGIAVGIEGNISEVTDAMNDLNNASIGAMDTDMLRIKSSGLASTSSEDDDIKKSEDMNAVIADAIKEALSSGITIDWNGRNLGRLVQTYA